MCPRFEKLLTVVSIQCSFLCDATFKGACSVQNIAVGTAGDMKVNMSPLNKL